MPFPEKPEGKILHFAPREKPKEPPVEPIFDRPALPEHGVVVEIETEKDERYRKYHRELVDRIRRAAEATTNDDNSIEIATRERIIQMAGGGSDIDKARVTENFDTQMITDRALAGMEEDEYVRLRTETPEDSRSAIEAAYTIAREKYGHLYPAARPTAFLPSLPEYDAPAPAAELPQPPAPESPKPSQSWHTRFRDWLGKLF